MTAAIRPACCAGADNGKIYPQFHPVDCACRGGFAADSGADRSRIGAKPVADVFTLADPDVFTFAKPVAKPIAIAQPIALSESDTDGNAHLDAHANRFDFQAQTRSRIWPSSASTR